MVQACLTVRPTSLSGTTLSTYPRPLRPPPAPQTLSPGACSPDAVAGSWDKPRARPLATKVEAELLLFSTRTAKVS
jgi:hypothetical protein